MALERFKAHSARIQCRWVDLLLAINSSVSLYSFTSAAKVQCLRLYGFFAVDVDTVSTGLLDGTVSGIMGLAFSAIASTGATPFWQTLIANNQLSSPEMSFWLTRSSSTNTQDVSGGVFTLGGTNASLFSGTVEFLDMPTTTPTFWLLTLSSKFQQLY